MCSVKFKAPMLINNKKAIPVYKLVVDLSFFLKIKTRSPSMVISGMLI